MEKSKFVFRNASEVAAKAAKSKIYGVDIVYKRREIKYIIQDHAFAHALRLGLDAKVNCLTRQGDVVITRNLVTEKIGLFISGKLIATYDLPVDADEMCLFIDNMWLRIKAHRTVKAGSKLTNKVCFGRVTPVGEGCWLTECFVAGKSEPVYSNYFWGNEEEVSSYAKFSLRHNYFTGYCKIAITEQ